MNIPNYAMLRLMLVECDIVKKEFPDAEQMPKGAICPGYDIRLIQPIAVLRYLYGVKTQWSCQGNHKEYEPRRAYILLAPGENFPIDLRNIILAAGLMIETVGDCDDDGVETGQTRFKFSSCSEETRGMEQEKLVLLNEKYLNLLDSWSKSKVIEHLCNMRDRYYRDVVLMFSP